MYHYALAKDGEVRCLDDIGSRPRSINDYCKGICLSPFETDFKHNLLSPADRKIIEREGVAVVHAPWNQVEREDFDFTRYGHTKEHRKALPLLKSASGRLCALSSIEAIASALIITGFDEEAMDILSHHEHGNGEMFFEMNEALFKAYKECKSGRDVQKTQLEIKETLDQKAKDSMSPRSPISRTVSMEDAAILEYELHQLRLEEAEATAAQQQKPGGAGASSGSTTGGGGGGGSGEGQTTGTPSKEGGQKGDPEEFCAENEI